MQHWAWRMQMLQWEYAKHQWTGSTQIPLNQHSCYSYSGMYSSIGRFSMDRAKGGIFCGICKEETTNRKYRKAIEGESAEKFVAIFQTYATEQFPGQNLQNYLRQLPPNSAYICRNCQERAVRYEKLRDQLKSLTDKITGDLSSLMENPPSQSVIQNVPQIPTTPTRPRVTTKESPAVQVQVTPVLFKG